MTEVACDASAECLHTICKYCDAPLRWYNQPKEDHPGTKFGVRKNQACGRCHQRGGPPRKSKPLDCIECGVELHPSKKNRSQNAQARFHGGGGRCTACYKRKRRNDKIRKEFPTERARYQAIALTIGEEDALRRKDERDLAPLKERDRGLWASTLARRKRIRDRQKREHIARILGTRGRP